MAHKIKSLGHVWLQESLSSGAQTVPLKMYLLLPAKTKHTKQQQQTHHFPNSEKSLTTFTLASLGHTPQSTTVTRRLFCLGQNHEKPHPKHMHCEWGRRVDPHKNQSEVNKKEDACWTRKSNTLIPEWGQWSNWRHLKLVWAVRGSSRCWGLMD